MKTIYNFEGTVIELLDTRSYRLPEGDILRIDLVHRVIGSELDVTHIEVYDTAEGVEADDAEQLTSMPCSDLWDFDQDCLSIVSDIMRKNNIPYVDSIA